MILRFRALRINPNIINYNRAAAETTVLVKTTLDSIVEEVRAYPPPPGSSTYERTWQLGMGWRTNVSIGALGIEGRITNVATDRKRGRRYATFVQGAYQTGLHATTGWRRIDEVAASRRVEYRQELQRIYKRNLNTVSAV